MSFNLALHQVRLSNYQISEEKEKKKRRGRQVRGAVGRKMEKERQRWKEDNKKACVRSD